MKEYILRNYTIQFDMYNKPVYAFGQVFNNPKFKDGSWVRTSKIKEYIPNEKIITLNSTYILENNA